MSIEKITKQLAGHNQNYPPVELWDPPFCGKIDILIKKDGSWLYNKSKIKRLSLVKLFASILKKEKDDYFLVTPVEKVQIGVEKAPYVITQWQWLKESKSPTMQLTTNLGDKFTLDSEHPLTIGANDELQVVVRQNLTATIHRNIFYQWIEIANEKNQHLYIHSAGLELLIGCY